MLSPAASAIKQKIQSNVVNDVRTIIAFVNPGSGGGQGVKVLEDLTEILGTEKVFNLKIDKGPKIGLEKWKGTPNLVVIAAGGDGTVGWILSIVDQIDFGNHVPCVVPLALGTANDMSRILNWGPGYAGEKLKPFVEKLASPLKAEVVKLDRWKVVIDPLALEEKEKLDIEIKKRLKKNKNESESLSEEEEPEHDEDRKEVIVEEVVQKDSNLVNEIINEDTEKPQQIQFIANNYFSIGIDSKMLHDFEKLRKNHPELFPHRAINYGWYGLIGIKHMMESSLSLRHKAILKINNETKRIPSSLKTIVCLNVPSYSGGTNPWHYSRNEHKIPSIVPQSICDGIIELFGMEGAFHIGRNIAGMSRGGVRVGQAKSVEIISIQASAVQVDGEAFIIPPSKITVTHHNQANMLFNLAKDNSLKKKQKLNGTYIKKEKLSDSKKTTKLSDSKNKKLSDSKKTTKLSDSKNKKLSGSKDSLSDSKEKSIKEEGNSEIKDE